MQALDANMTLVEHLRELRKRLVVSLIAITVGFLAVYGFAEHIFAFLTQPLLDAIPEGHERKMIFTGVAQPFLIDLKVGIFGGIVVAMPVVLHQAWKFIAPALYANEKRYFMPFIVTALLCFAAGGAFAYFVAFPFSFQFFLGYSTTDIQPMISISEYLDFVQKLLLAFGLMFEMPLIMFVLAKFGMITPHFLSENRRWATVIMALAAAIFTPADAISMLAMLIPLLILYEISLLVVRMVYKGQPGLVDAEGNLIEDDEEVADERGDDDTEGDDTTEESKTAPVGGEGN